MIFNFSKRIKISCRIKKWLKNCIYPEIQQKIEREHGHGLGHCWICTSHCLNKDYPMIVRKEKLQLLSHIIYRASVWITGRDEKAFEDVAGRIKVQHIMLNAKNAF